MRGEGRRGKGGEKALLALFGRLSRRQQNKLIAFAELLAGETPSGRARPEPGPRAAGETVTMAIRRLVRGYPMLDRRRLMPEACDLMAQHALHGRAAAEVIVELEAAFARHYERERGKGKREKA